jgi:parallel beta-helix repeat protein
MFGSVQNLNTSLVYYTIQSAIDAPETLTGHVIYVNAATYHEHVVVNKSVHLLGQKTETTIIDGNGVGTVLNVIANGVEISGFTIQRGFYGVVVSSNFSSIFRNNVTANAYGVTSDHSSNNAIFGNNITANSQLGIYLYYSSGNAINVNNVTANAYGVTSDHSSNNTIIWNNIAANSQAGIYLYYSSSNPIYGNNVTAGSNLGLYFSSSSSNTVIGNNVAENSHFGIWLDSSSDTSSFFHNSFVNNGIQAYVDSSCVGNVWDNGYPSGGNYWSNYTGVDKKSGPGQDQPGSDGIGDTPHVIDPSNKDNYPLTKPYGGVHDVGVANVTTSKTGCLPKPTVGQGYGMNITITLLNYGFATETFSLIVYANATIIQTIPITLESRNSTMITLTWNTASFDKGNYTISAYATPVPYETYTADNNFTDGTVYLCVPGDVDGNRIVNMLDLYKIALVFGATIGQPNYTSNCDLDNNGIINMLDLYIAAIHFGQTAN